LESSDEKIREVFGDFNILGRLEGTWREKQGEKK
jgi:hypothetical protein